MSEDNGNAPQQPPQPGQVALNVQVMPQGVMFNCAYPVTLGLGDEMMDQLTKQWVMQRPQLLLEIVQTAKKAQRQELAIIKHVNSHRNN